MSRVLLYSWLKAKPGGDYSLGDFETQYEDKHEKSDPPYKNVDEFLPPNSSILSSYIIS